MLRLTYSFTILENLLTISLFIRPIFEQKKKYNIISEKPSLVCHPLYSLDFIIDVVVGLLYDVALNQLRKISHIVHSVRIIILRFFFSRELGPWAHWVSFIFVFIGNKNSTNLQPSTSSHICWFLYIPQFSMAFLNQSFKYMHGPMMMVSYHSFFLSFFLFLSLSDFADNMNTCFVGKIKSKNTKKRKWLNGSQFRYETIR